MSLQGIIKSLFGSKADRDFKAVKPILLKVLAIYPEINALSDDDLRARTEALKERVRAVEAPFEERMAQIKAELEKDSPISEKEKLATESDKVVKDEDEAIEKILELLEFYLTNINHYKSIEKESEAKDALKEASAIWSEIILDMWW